MKVATLLLSAFTLILPPAVHADTISGVTPEFNEPGPGPGPAPGPAPAPPPQPPPRAPAPDVYTVFHPAGTFDNGFTLSGTLTLDDTATLFTASTLSAGIFGFDTVVGQACDFPTASDCALTLGSGAGGPELNLVFALVSFNIGGRGSVFGSIDDPANGYVSDIYINAQDTIQLVYGGTSDTQLGIPPTAAPTPTPEPSTLLFLSTGLLGAAGAIRRRFVRS